MCVSQQFRKEKVRTDGLSYYKTPAMPHKPAMPWVPSAYGIQSQQVRPHNLLFASACMLVTSPTHRPMHGLSCYRDVSPSGSPSQMAPPPSPAAGNITALNPSSPRPHRSLLPELSPVSPCRGGWAHGFSCYLWNISNAPFSTIFIYFPNVKSASWQPSIIMCPYSTPNPSDLQVQSSLTAQGAHKVPFHPPASHSARCQVTLCSALSPTSQWPRLRVLLTKLFVALGGHQ